MKKIKKKTLTLDLSTWRCGGVNNVLPYGLGRGDTELLNNKNYMCCLGQFALQLGMKREDILYVGTPLEVGKSIPLLSNRREGGLSNTVLSSNCMIINDNELTTIDEKILLIRKELKKKGITLRVKNRKKNL